ncbi:hypothetical protein BCU85_19315 [Vibrio lentus]|uniref:hypothetical protein n=1 Tax=Vibrio lentus TaxID=136468 RepID=UPI000C85DD4F|nr:hypothetical protein [Vibrio lentus]MCC4815444.1 hypothetical protein [Vibrio lentus]PMG72689.1 hypothetical protein BCU85_19315 [Vibrio lentus]PMJ78387.1 hypothetical protein BCU14_22635 [Vibrio lentus]PMK91602.1 hypothetical protein BCT88_05010 [Vibrio lentus]PML22624.1 hypothetical protein BCT80_11715 [Vibrio lentus]
MNKLDGIFKSLDSIKENYRLGLDYNGKHLSPIFCGFAIINDSFSMNLIQRTFREVTFISYNYIDCDEMKEYYVINFDSLPLHEPITVWIPYSSIRYQSESYKGLKRDNAHFGKIKKLSFVGITPKFGITQEAHSEIEKSDIIIAYDRFVSFLSEIGLDNKYIETFKYNGRDFNENIICASNILRNFSNDDSKKRAVVLCDGSPLIYDLDAGIDTNLYQVSFFSATPVGLKILASLYKDSCKKNIVYLSGSGYRSMEIIDKVRQIANMIKQGIVLTLVEGSCFDIEELVGMIGKYINVYGYVVSDYGMETESITHIKDGCFLTNGDVDDMKTNLTTLVLSNRQQYEQDSIYSDCPSENLGLRDKAI